MDLRHSTKHGPENDAQYTIQCEVCGETLGGGKTMTLIDCECGEQYIVTITRLTNELTDDSTPAGSDSGSSTPSG